MLITLGLDIDAIAPETLVKQMWPTVTYIAHIAIVGLGGSLSGAERRMIGSIEDICLPAHR